MIPIYPPTDLRIAPYHSDGNADRGKIDDGMFVTHVCQWQACEQKLRILDFNGFSSITRN